MYIGLEQELEQNCVFPETSITQGRFAKAFHSALELYQLFSINMKEDCTKHISNGGIIHIILVVVSQVCSCIFVCICICKSLVSLVSLVFVIVFVFVKAL